MTTLMAAIGFTVTYGCMLFGELMGDKPMPDDMKIWFMSGILLMWALTAVVHDLKGRKDADN